MASEVGRSGKVQQKKSHAKVEETAEMKYALANWVDSRGLYVTDKFIDKLLEVKNPKEYTERVRMSNYGTRQGRGAKPLPGEPHAKKMGSKYKGPYSSIAEARVAEHFKGAVKIDVFEKVASYVIENTLRFPPRTTARACCHCPLEEPVSLNSGRPFFGRTFEVGEIGGLLQGKHVLQQLASRCELSGAKLLLTYEVHASVNSNGQFDDVEIADAETDVRIIVKPSYAEEVKSLMLLGEEAYAAKYNDGLNSGDGAMSDLRSLLLKSATRLQRCSAEPIREFADCLYEAIRDDILCNLDGLDCAVVAVGGIHITTPPGIQNYFQLRDVNLHLPGNELREKKEHLQGSIARALRKVKAAQEADRSIREAEEKIRDSQRMQRRKKLHTDVAEKQRNDDWRLDTGSQPTAKGLDKVAVRKFGKLFLYTRWSRLVRRLLEVMRTHEVYDDWQRDERDMASGKAKVGKIFLCMRWSRIVHKVLEVSRRREMREKLKYY